MSFPTIYRPITRLVIVLAASSACTTLAYSDLDATALRAYCVPSGSSASDIAARLAAADDSLPKNARAGQLMRQVLSTYFPCP